MNLRIAGVLCIMLFVSAFSIDKRVISWKVLKAKDNITSFSGTARSNGLIPTRVEMTTRSSPRRVIQVITDMANYKRWVPYCKTSFLLQRPSDSVFYGYQRVSAPLVKDRDVAIRCTVRKLVGESYELFIEAVPTFVKMESGAIRIQYLETHYRIYQDAASVTHIIQVSEVDIGGSIPHFLLNWLNKYQPYETCETLRNIMESGS